MATISPTSGVSGILFTIMNITPPPQCIGIFEYSNILCLFRWWCELRKI